MKEDISNELQAIYDEVPDIDCKGHCWNSCGPIDMNDEERERIRARGVEIEPFTHERAALWAADLPLHCAALDKQTGQCTVYDARPLICRLWGVTETMRCKHDCTPEGILSDDEAFDLLSRAMGYQEEVARLLQDPELAPLFKRLASGDRSVEPELIALMERRNTP